MAIFFVVGLDGLILAWPLMNYTVSPWPVNAIVLFVMYGLSFPALMLSAVPSVRKVYDYRIQKLATNPSTLCNMTSEVDSNDK